MINPHLKDLADRLGSDEMPPKRIASSLMKGFEYVSALGFHVADAITLHGLSWYECRLTLEYKGAFMLTPAQFWLYHDHCLTYRKDIVENSFKNKDESEWFDALVELDADLVISPVVLRGPPPSHKKGRRYMNILPRQFEVWFSRDDVNPRTGVPSLDQNLGTWTFSKVFLERTRALARSFNGFSYLEATTPPEEGKKRQGARECRR